MLRGLLIDDKVRADIATLKAKAAEACVPLAEVIRLSKSRADTGQQLEPKNEVFTIEIPEGYMVTYTHEQQPTALCHHISISVRDAKPRMGPHPAAVSVILAEFGFHNIVGVLPTWTSTLSNGSYVIEGIEPLDGDLSRIMSSRRRH